MAINSNDTKSLIWKHVKYSIEFSFTFAKKHPFVSSTLSFFILFCALSPSITWFFIYSLPLMFFFTILLIIFFSIPNFKHFERDVDSKPSRKISHVDKDHENVNIDNKQKAFLRARSVRRRKSKKHIQTGAEELIQGAPFRISFNDHDFVDKGALIEEKLKDIREVEVHSISDRAECSSASSIFKNSGPAEYSDCSYEASGKCFKSFSSIYERKTECFGEMENEGARNKAVQWKEDDQKNLMDLGLSEIERTKRLESLMARRRARKMLSLQVRRSLMNIGCKETLTPISSILIPKNKSSSTSQFSPTPGSAPSILGPNRNPFDLPYDQHEEKPNVRGGSFLQEFMSAQEQKDRNESLRIEAAFLGDSNLDQHEPIPCSDVPSRQMFQEASESSKSRHRLGREDNDRVVEEVTTQASEPETNVAYKGEHSREGLDISQDEKESSEVQIKSVLVEDISNRTSSTSSSEEDGPFYKIDKDAILKSIASPALRNLSSDPSHPSSSLLDSTRENERFYYPNRPVHRTSCQSIASDLQVEVSEVGSPPLTNDGSSSADEEISIDGEIEKAITSNSEDTLISSSHLARVDENESNSKEVREVTEQDIVDFGFSRFQMSENNVPHNVPSERLIEPDSIGSSSFPPPRTERTQASSYQQRRPEGLSVVGDRLQGSLLQPEFSVQQLPFASASLVSPTSVLQPNCLIEQGSSSNLDHVQNDRSMNISSERSDSIASQESELSLNNSILQVSELPSETETSNSALHNDSAELIIGSDSERHSENVAFSTIGQGHHSIEASSTSSSMSVSQPKFATDQLPDEVTTGSCDPNTSRSSTLSLKDTKVQSSVPHSQTQKSAENPKSLTSNDIQETLRDKSGSRHIEEVVFSTISQSFDESQASSSPQDFMVEQVPTASTSSPSPNSMIQPKFSVNESSSYSEEQKRVQNSSNSEDHIPGFLSERAVNQDSISLQSTVREVPTASSSSSSPKSVLEPKSSTGQGPMLNSNREEQIGESPSPRMSRNTRILLIDSAADKLHHADAKMKPLNDEEKSHEDATNHNDVKKEDLPKIQEVSESLKNSTTKHHKSSDVENSASTSTNKNQNLVTNTGTGEDRGAKEPEKTHGPIIATQENSEKGNTTEAKENIKSQSERTDSKEKAKDS
ncbi:uncharacterized protein LOC107794683 [Nicotiana tabacum]|uniref:Uncharacterized protein LOC107794683 n=1 Tax=Nicotiana tabacum TaxID=4097 RepID=A0A1S4A7R9_TOBAC|nr:PREDICTED: uncharacterized protein LOC107794683 [Nicotiana tabacum]